MSRDYRLTDRDMAVLSFLAEHRLALAAHVGVLLGTSSAAASTRLTRLTNARVVKSHPAIPGQPRPYQITGRGLAVVGSSLPRPRLDLRAYQHDVGVAWLWLAARGGTFGPLEETIAERRLRSLDGSREPGAEPRAVRLGGFGPRGQERLHYPDLLLQTTGGRRIALELELSPKGRHRLEDILAGYGADRRYDSVVYLVDSATIARAVQTAARRVGISPLVHIQRVRVLGAREAGRGAPARERAVTRQPREASR